LIQKFIPDDGIARPKGISSINDKLNTSDVPEFTTVIAKEIRSPP
jgi:hypothetical protein